ncbi:MAG: DUF4116 domain-containing protein [Polynucleobacter sp.]|nr:DUF4116 domain-containing protein [Polynucleobacter sp.]
MSNLSPTELKEKAKVLKELARLSELKHFSRHEKLETYVKTISTHFLTDIETAKAIVSADGTLISNLNKDLQKNREIILLAIKNGAYTNLLSKEFYKDKEIALACASQNGWAIKDFDPAFCSDIDVVLAAGKKNSLSLKHASKKLLSDPKSLMLLATQIPSVLEFAPEELLDDKNFALSLINQDGYVYRYFSEGVRADLEVFTCALKAGALVLEYAPESFKNNKELVVDIVKKNASELEYASDQLRSDAEVIAAASTNDPWAAARHALKLWSPNLIYVAPEYIRESDQQEDREEARKFFSKVVEQILKQTQIAVGPSIKRCWFVITPTVLRDANLKQMPFLRLADEKEARYLVVPLDQNCLSLISNIVVQSGNYESTDRHPELPFYIAVEMDAKLEFSDYLESANTFAKDIGGSPLRVFLYYQTVGYIEQVFRETVKTITQYQQKKLKLGNGYLKGLLSKSGKADTKYVVYRNLWSRGYALEQYGLNLDQLVKLTTQSDEISWDLLPKHT